MLPAMPNLTRRCPNERCQDQPVLPLHTCHPYPDIPDREMFGLACYSVPLQAKPEQAGSSLACHALPYRDVPRLNKQRRACPSMPANPRPTSTEHAILACLTSPYDDVTDLDSPFPCLPFRSRTSLTGASLDEPSRPNQACLAARRRNWT